MEELRKLVLKWRRRRERLRKKASDIGKVDTPANKLHSWQFSGQFAEVDKCATLLNRLERENKI